MSDLLRPEMDAAPWRPAGDVELLEELDRYDIPLAGLIRHAGSEYLFACLFGEAEGANIWSYVRVDERDVAALRAATGDDLQRVIEATLANAAQVVALAIDWRLTYWTMIDAGEEGSWGIVKRFMARHTGRRRREEQGAAELEQRVEQRVTAGASC